MWYLLNAYWIPLLLAGLLGVIVGWMSCNNQTIAHNARPSWFSGWVPWGVAAAALAAVAALQMLLPGRQGLLLDTALMLFGAYMLGCCVGCLLRPKPAAHLTTAGATKSSIAGKPSTSGNVATAAAVGTAATAAGLAAAKAAPAKSSGSVSTTTTSSVTGKSTTSGTTSGTSSASASASKPVVTATETTKTGNIANLTSTPAGTNGTVSNVATALGAAATGVAATAAAGTTKGVAAVSSAATTVTTPTSAIASKTAGDGDIKTFTGAPKFGERPMLYNAPRGGKGDELSLIWGVAEKLEHKMNAAGIWHFDQIANWSVANIEWFEHEFEGFKGRLDRDKWIEQCKKLAAGWRPDGHVGQHPKG
jgi:predicted flap endonuclease-1-like 5' DNA nuclease